MMPLIIIKIVIHPFIGFMKILLSNYQIYALRRLI